MKKYFFLCLLFFCLSCKKEPTFVYGTISTFYANGRIMPRNGFDLSVSAQNNRQNCSKNYYSLTVKHNAKNDTLQEQIRIGGLEIGKVGKITVSATLHNSACDTTLNAYFAVAMKDLLIADYGILNKSDSYVTIDSYDSKTKELKGSFNFWFVVTGTTPQVARIYTDTVKFNDAKFTVRMND